MGDRTHYTLLCAGCGHRQADDGLLLSCPDTHPPALLHTDYAHQGFTVDPAAEGIGRYAKWLPVARSPHGTGRPVVFHSERLAFDIGLSDLWIAFSGYWPEKGAFTTSGTFKEFEARTVAARLPESFGNLVVASAGNTASAFLASCSGSGTPAVLIIPESGLAALGPATGDPAVRVIVVTHAEYSDCIRLAGALSALPGFYGEGGILNVARRDGLGTVLLAAFEAMGTLPDHYVQAVGSGTGAVATHEAAMRLLAADAGTDPPRLLLAQNASFAPLHRAWHSPGAPADPWDTAATRDVFAPELTNRIPPFAVTGGVRDCLTASRGDVLVAGAADAARARAGFEQLEGIDIEPAPAVAIAVLRQAVAAGRIRRTDRVLLNVTGGGRARHATETGAGSVTPHLRIDRNAALATDGAHRIAEALQQLVGVA